jgi:hypothetical protein
VVVQRLDPNADAFKNPVTLRLNVQPQVAGTADRGLTLVLSVERDDESSLNLVFQQIANGKKAGQPEIVKEPAKVTRDSTETVPSVALSNIPLVGYLFAGKKMKVKAGDERGDLIVFITPVLVGSDQQGIQPAHLGKRVNITKTTRTNNPISEFFQTVAIDPLGRFVLYTQFNAACQKNVLKFQRVNPATLSKIGIAKTLAGCGDFANSPTGAYGLDVIPLL